MSLQKSHNQVSDKRICQKFILLSKVESSHQIGPNVFVNKVFEIENNDILKFATGVS